LNCRDDKKDMMKKGGNRQQKMNENFATSND